MNVQAFQELKRVLRSVPDDKFSLRDWDRCACGHATRDSWFRQQGFTKCRDFDQAAAFFQIPRWKAEYLFSAPHRRVVTPAEFIREIDAMLSAETAREVIPVAVHARRQAIIDDLLAKANKAAQTARRVATALVTVLF